MSKDKGDGKKRKSYLANMKDTFGESPFIHAVIDGNDEMVTFLLDQKVDINILSRKGLSPLHIAAKNGNLAMVKRLVDAGADPSILDKKGVFTPLLLAAQSGKKDIVTYLKPLDKRTEPSQLFGALLYFYSKEGKVSLVKKLLGSKMIDIEYEDPNGWTPLMVASRFGRKTIVELLLSKGANVNKRDSKGMTPLHLAARAGIPEVIETLIKRGGDVNAKDDSGSTPIFYTKKAEASRVFAEAPGFDPTIKNRKGVTQKKFYEKIKARKE